MQRAVKPKKSDLPKKTVKKQPKSELSPELDETIRSIIEGKENIVRYTFDEHRKQVKKILEE